MTVAETSERNAEATTSEGDHPIIDVVIYISPHCANCHYATVIADQIAREFPTVTVRFVDMSAPAEPIPENVFATPTYLLNGRVWSLGNPSEEEVRMTLMPMVSA